MSLLAWFPFIKDGNNQGLTTEHFDISNMNLINGKLGKCIEINNTSNTIKIDKLAICKKVTICFWANEMEETCTNWQDFFRLVTHYDDGTKISDSDTRLENYNNSSTGTVYARWYSTAFNKTYPTYTGSIAIGNVEMLQNVWHHIVLEVDFESHTWASWIDGEYQDKQDINPNALFFTGTIRIGNTDINCCLNDLRIYDHLLSNVEIKNIYNNCLLHYRFDDDFIKENLIVESNNVSSWVAEGCTKSQESDSDFEECIKIISNAENRRIYREVRDVWTTKGDIFTVSFWAKSTENGVTVDMSRSLLDFSETFILSTGWARYVGKITNSTSTSTGTLSFRIKEGNKTVYIANVKLSKGIEDSNWSPNPSDELYSNLGFNDLIVYDESGYGYDGEKSKELLLSTDCIMGTKSLNLIGEDYTSYIRVPNYPQFEKNFTWNVWVKQNNNSLPTTFQTIISQGRDYNGADYGFNLFMSNGAPEIRYGYWATPENQNIGLSSNTTLDNEWHMLTASIDNEGIGRIYIDGELKNTATKATICKYSQAAGNLVIGKLSYQYSSSNTYFPFNGLIDDIQLFGNTLSDSDIRELYSIKGKIDKSDNFLCNNFIEKPIENFFSSQNFPTSSVNLGGFVGTKELVECPSSMSGKATKITCTTAGTGFYFGGYNVFGSNTSLVHGEQYIWSMYIRSDNRKSVTFNVECSSKQQKGTFEIGTKYKKISSIFTYSNTSAYNAFTCYSKFNVGENLYIHSFKVEKYNSNSRINKKSVFETNNIVEFEQMETKTMDDGAVFARIFWHNIEQDTTLMKDEQEALNCSENNRFSKLYLINELKYNDQYEFILTYPSYKSSLYNRWIQTVSPLDIIASSSQTIETMGYQEVHIDYTKSWYYGMGKSPVGSTFLDCNSGSGYWYGAIGIYQLHTTGGQSGFPAPTQVGMSQIQTEVELWIRIDPKYYVNKKTQIGYNSINTNQIIEI